MNKFLLLDLKDSFRIEDSWCMSPTEIDRRSGNNLGNFAFRYSILKFILKGNIDIGGFDSLSNCSEYDSILLACSNWIGSSPMHERVNQSRFESLSKVNLPIVAFGLGSQLKYDQTFADLGQWTSALLYKLSESCESISVRDEFTAEILSNFGFGKIIVTGCPSNFISPRHDLGSYLIEKIIHQLKVGRKLIIPCGNIMMQQLLQVVKEPHDIRIVRHTACRFVPLIGKDGFPE